MNYAFHPEAEREFIETAARYEAEIPGLGIRFGAEVNRAIEILLENPKIGAQIGAELRHFVLRRFPHSIIYAEISGSLYVLAIPGKGQPPIPRDPNRESLRPAVHPSILCAGRTESPEKL